MPQKVQQDAAPGSGEELRTISEACAALRIGQTKCWEMIRAGVLQAVRLGSRSTRIKKSSIDQIIQHGAPPSSGEVR